jgi:uncharacterized spore protein YtfJ
MDIQEALSQTREAINVKRVYGEPYERNGVVVIPAATVGGAGGGGSGEDVASGNVGGGAGFGLNGRPVGAYVIEEGNVRWEPAIDVTRIVLQLIFAALGLAFLLRRSG